MIPYVLWHRRLCYFFIGNDETTRETWYLPSLPNIPEAVFNVLK